jgi:hypothetical protein
MSETKRNALRRQTHFSMILAHGTYGYTRDLTTIKPGQYIIFISRTSRYLPQSIINPEFKDIFTQKHLIESLIKGTLRHVPPFLIDIEHRTYGPGDQCPNLEMQMHDPEWSGMGWHKLPLVWREELKIRPGEGNGHTIKLSEYNTIGVTFIVACRATGSQMQNYQGVTNVYQFPPGSYEHNLQLQDEISARIIKRRRNNNSLRKNKNQPASKRRVTSAY